MKGIKTRAFVPDKAARIVDAHIHVWSPDRKKYPLAPGFTPDDLWLPSFTPDDHFQYSRRVGKIRLNLVQMTWYGLDHSYILDLIASDPDTYTGIGIVSALSDVSLPDPGKAMLALAEGGIRVSWSSLAPFRPWAMARRPTLDLLPLIERVVNAFGPERVMWESDSGGPHRHEKSRA